MKDLLQSSPLKAILWILGAIIVLLLVFGLGVTIGSRRALFAGRFEENYYRNFYGPQGGPGGPPPFNQHGVAGEVIDLSSSTITVKDPDGDERSVVILSNTSIREGDATIMIGAITPGNLITVIGGPNAEGQIEARFIRVFASSSFSAPVLPPFPGTNQL